MKRRSGSAVAMVTLAITAPAFTQNQTESLSPMVAGGVPFRVEMELVDWVGDDLPAIHSAAYATLGDQLLLVGGKTSGLHNFTCDPDVNWPAAEFNGTLMVVDFWVQREKCEEQVERERKEEERRKREAEEEARLVELNKSRPSYFSEG